MNNTLLIIFAAYIAIGILYYGYSCFLFREVINREDYLPLALESLFCWPACLIVDIAFAIKCERENPIPSGLGRKRAPIDR